MIRISSLLLVFLMLAGCAQQESSEEEPPERELTGEIEITNQWARPGSAAGNSAGYLTIFNGTNEDNILDEITSDSVRNAELHESFDEDGHSGMRPVNNLTIASGDSLVLEPGGYHIMFMEIENDWKTDDSVEVTLVFSEADSIKTTLPVKNSPDD